MKINICYDKKWLRFSEDIDLPADYFFNPDFEYGSFTDPRDGHVYKTTVYNGQTWLAQNIDYNDKTDSVFVEQSVCAKAVLKHSKTPSDNSFCEGASRYYTFNASRKACPEGWHLPNQEDWSEIVSMGINAAQKYFFKLFAIGCDFAGNDPYGNNLNSTMYNKFWLEEGWHAENMDLGAHFGKMIDPRKNGQHIPVRCIKKE